MARAQPAAAAAAAAAAGGVASFVGASRPVARAQQAQQQPDGVLGLDVQLSNRALLLSQVDAALGRSRPPAVELLIASGLSGSEKVPWPRRLLGNPCGHALVAYRLPTHGNGIEHVAPELRGKQIVMNIVNPGHAANPSDIHVVNFLSLEAMLFGIGDTDGACGSEQGGVYNRHFTGLRIEELDDDSILAMHHAFLSLASQGNAGRLSFSITGGQVRGLARHFLQIGNQGLGNCAVWTSTGLVAAGLIRRPSAFPGRVWSMLHEGALRRWGSENVNVVHYAEVPECHKKNPNMTSLPGELVSLTGPLATWRYWRRERFARVVVSVEPGSRTATVTRRQEAPPTPPLQMQGPIPGITPGPRFVGISAGVLGLAMRGQRGWAAILALATTVLH
eukprot:COSAG05_NODE_726_length_7707_cov_30.238302_5_plen_391_part_00